MNKIAVIYWSQTGNTAIMAEHIAKGVKEAGVEVDLLNCENISGFDIAQYSKVAFGCPAMGDEVLEEYCFEPFFQDIESKLNGKRVALFGSYGWGDGQWMRDWVKRTDDAGAIIFKDEGFMLNETPDDSGKTDCETLGKEFSAF